MPCSLLYVTALLIFNVLSSQPFITPPSPTDTHTYINISKVINLKEERFTDYPPSVIFMTLTLLRGDFGYWWKVKETLTEKEKGKSIKILWVQSYRGIWLKPLQQMLHETAIRDLPSHLLSKWDAAFLPFPFLPRNVPPSQGKERQNMSLNGKENNVCGFLFFLIKQSFPSVSV